MTLLKHIYTTTPKLKTALNNNNHLEVVILLREYVYNNLLWGVNQSNLSLNNISNLEAEKIFKLLKERKIFFLCGSTALYLCKIYKLFGYEAKTYNYGFADIGLTHVVTLVHVNDIGEVLQDPSFNMAYYDINHHILSFKKLLELINNKKFDSIKVIKRTVNKIKICFINNVSDDERYSLDKKAKVLIDDDKYFFHSNKYYYSYGNLDYHSSYLRRNEGKIINALNTQKKNINNNNVTSVFELIQKQI